ncbi:MAG: hypothetical protein ACK5IQ_06880 [Bacteroidales bacterium]
MQTANTYHIGGQLGEGFCCGDEMRTKSTLPADNVDYEKLQYYYHPDHLGSASYITNLDGA